MWECYLMIAVMVAALVTTCIQIYRDRTEEALRMTIAELRTEVKRLKMLLQLKGG